MTSREGKMIRILLLLSLLVTPLVTPGAVAQCSSALVAWGAYGTAENSPLQPRLLNPPGGSMRMFSGFVQHRMVSVSRVFQFGLAAVRRATCRAQHHIDFATPLRLR